MDNDAKLKIALEALLELKNYNTNIDDAADDMQDIACDALADIQREHYLGETSGVVFDALVGVKGF